MDETQVTEDSDQQVDSGEVENEDGGLSSVSLFDSLYAAAEDEPSPEVEPEADGVITGHSISETIEEGYTDPEPEPVAEEEKPEPKKKVKRLHKKEVIDPDLPVEEVEEIEDTSEDDDDFLLPEEREQLKVVDFISERNNTNQGKELREYFKKQKEYIEDRLKQDPDINLAEDHEFNQFVQRSRPHIDPADIRSAEREMLIEEAEERALRRLRPEVERANIETKRLQIKPQVEQAKADAEQKAMSMIPESLAEDLKNRPPVEVQKDNPYEFNIVNDAVTKASTFASTFLDISKGMVEFNERDSVHSQLRSWLVNEQDVFIKSGQTKDSQGRPFMRRERYTLLPDEEKSKYWTWSDDQCVDIMQSRIKTQMEERLAEHEKAMQVYLNRGKPQAPAQAPAQSYSPPPPTKTTPRAGGTPPQNSNQPPSPLTLLGM